MLPALLTEDQAAELIGVKPRTLAAWRANGRHNLPYVKAGRVIRYRRTDLEKWIESRVVGAEGGEK